MDLGDLRSWGRHWNDAAMERIADMLPRRAPSRTWPMLGMLAIGLVAGAATRRFGAAQRADEKGASGGDDSIRRVKNRPARHDANPLVAGQAPFRHSGTPPYSAHN